MYVSCTPLIRSGAALVASLMAVATFASSRSGTTLIASSEPVRASAPAASPSRDRALQALAELPLYFEPHALGGRHAFSARGQGYHVLVAPRA